jgi:transposase
MPRKNNILNLPGFSIKKVSGTNPLILEVNYYLAPRCPFCGEKKLRKKDSYTRVVKHESIGHRPTILCFKAFKFYCLTCRRYFNQRFPGIEKYQRASAHLQKQIFYQHTDGISQKRLSESFKLGKATIERWYHKFYVLENQKLNQSVCPTVLGIDEHSFSRKEGYATTLCDLRKHRVFDIVKGKSANDLGSYLSSLPGKERVKVICMDLSNSYRQLVQQYFPQAKIVSDRFHVIRLILHQFMQAYQLIDPKIKYQRGLLAALRTNPDNLTEKRKQRRDEYFKQQPAIETIYKFKRRLHYLLTKKTVSAKRCRKLIPIYLKMIESLKESGFKSLQTLGKTLYQWKDEVARMWRFTKSNGITEGFHRKMKLIQRRAYGFRNFENYRLRVRVLCS